MPRMGTLAVLLSRGCQLDIGDRKQEVFPLIIGVAFVAIEIGSLRQIQKQAAQAGHIGGGSGRQPHPPRLSPRRHKEVGFETIKITTFSRTVASVFLAPVDFAAADTYVITDGDRAT